MRGLSKDPDPEEPGFGLSPKGMICFSGVGKILNPNLEIRNKFKYQMYE
jgi:hypothetical protein